MRTSIILACLVALLFFEACSDTSEDINRIEDPYLAKKTFNSEWEKQGIGIEEWYYRMTVIDAPANTRAMGIAEGHRLHPETIRWEITKDMLIGWSAHASVLGADHEVGSGASKHYRGAPVVAFAITSHADLESGNEGSTRKPSDLAAQVANIPWHARKYFKVNWANNIVGQLKRSDGLEGISSGSMAGRTMHLIDSSWVGNPKRSRFSNDYVDVTTRHPIEVSNAAVNGEYGLAFREDTAAPVIDIRHFFMRKAKSDFVPLPYQDEVPELDLDGQPILSKSGAPRLVKINKRFGLFRTNYDGRPTYDRVTGTMGDASVINATIFNIWQKSVDDNGNVVPVEERVVKPIVYYMNVLHPENLMRSSYRVAEQWDKALRNAVFYAQPGKYKTINDVPAMWILKRNSCHVANVAHWLNEKRPDLANIIETSARATLSEVTDKLNRAIDASPNASFSDKQSRETRAKRELEQICSALEFYTQSSDEQFVYQRPGDLHFNLLNLEVENNPTKWSGYGPMFSDPITGETISATANVNMKYIDNRSQQLAKQIGLLKSKMPGLEAVYGSGVGSPKFEKASNLVDERALTKIYDRLAEIKKASDINIDRLKTRVHRVFDNKANIGMSLTEKESIHHAHMALARFMNAIDDQSKTSHDYDLADLISVDHFDDRTNAMMDPIGFIDDISVGVAIKYAALSEHERFLNIREIIYESVMLHELGHNLGLRHNMAASSDALNYGEAYWRMETLPSDLRAAKAIVTDRSIIDQLQACLKGNEELTNGLNVIFGGKHITTQDCLQQKNGMYASIMDYHASALADINGLGLYDKAAIKWAYGQVVEIFPKENLKLDADKTDLAHWLKFNNYRDIPKSLLKDLEAINQRQHVKFSWNGEGVSRSFPSNAVPYAYCDDPQGEEGPRCLAYDFGPDMRSSAQWLRSRFWQQYLLMHFAKDDSWTTSTASMKPLVQDIDILNKFTNMMRWYYRYSQDDPEFKGSYAEQDYLSALSIGLNHFAHVIGLPESGAHISAPTWTIEDQRSLATDVGRLAAANVLVPFKDLTECGVKSVTTINSMGQIEGLFDYRFIDVPLGAGRPFYPAISHDIEDRFMLYSGSALVKKFALYLLTAPLSVKKSSETMEKNDLLAMTWYRMFPEAVSKIYGAVIGKHYDQLGPILTANGSIVARDVIDEKTLAVIDYQDQPSVLPAMDDSLPLFAAANAIAFIPSTINQESDLNKSIKISCRGCSDEMDYSDTGEGNSVVRYAHWSGDEYKAAKFPQMPSIGADLLEQANRQKDRYLKLGLCIENEQVRKNDPFCQCVKTVDRRTFDEWICCDEQNHDCAGPQLEAVGDGICSIADLEKRQKQSRDQLDAMVGFIDGLRRLMKQAGN